MPVVRARTRTRVSVSESVNQYDDQAALWDKRLQGTSGLGELITCSRAFKLVIQQSREERVAVLRMLLEKAAGTSEKKQVVE